MEDVEREDVEREDVEKEDVQIEIVKEHLSKFFTNKELETLKPCSNMCSNCKETCGNLARLNECVNKSIMCLNCVDNLYDLGNNADYLFDCPCCNTQINDFEITSSSQKSD
jgi:hypothetical protein